MIRLLIIILFLFPFQADHPCPQTDKSYEDAEEAYLNFDLGKSRAILTELERDPGIDNETKCKVLRLLALQDWKFYRRKELAIKRLHTAIRSNGEVFESWLLKARIERESEDYHRAKRAALMACKLAHTENQTSLAAHEFARTVYDWSVSKLRSGRELDEELLTDCSNRLSVCLESDPANTETARLMLGISLLRGAGSQALSAWKSYYHITDVDQAKAYLKPQAEVLEKYLPGWEKEQVEPYAMSKIIKALAGSRFYNYALMLARRGDDEITNHLFENSETTDFLSYAKYLEVLEEETNSYYQRITSGEKREAEESKYRDFLESHREALWNKLTFASEGAHKYSEEAFLEMTDRHFGARGFTGSTGNFNGFSLALGHIVNQEVKQIEQYGRRAQLTFTQLDGMISNGYSSWFWEGRQIGGWASSREITQVRSAYLSGPVRAWRMVADSLEAAKQEKLVEKYLRSDDPASMKKGISRKLELNALKDMYHQLKGTGLTGKKLYFAFVRRYEYCIQESSIFAHEGRHSIDALIYGDEYRNWSSEEREFRAKLSEIVFAPEPRFALAKMFHALGNTGHGRANTRILDILKDYLKFYPKQKDNYSVDNSFSNVLLLSNDQIKECFRNADPLYKTYQSKIN